MLKLIIQLLIYTVLIIIMIIGLQKASIYFQNKTGVPYNDRKMKILEKIILSKDKEIYLIKLYDKIYFLGVSPNNISILKELDFKNEEL